MNFEIQIPCEDGSSYWCFSLDFSYKNYKTIYVKNVCIIDIIKYHNHRYDIKGFFYPTKYIYYRECIGSKKELYHLILNLLKENL